MTAPDPSADVRDTADEWAELRALAAAATPGEPYWYAGREWREFEKVGEVYSSREETGTSVDICRYASPENAAFIAAANPATITRLLDTLDAVRALADEWDSWAEGRSTTRIDAFRDAAAALHDTLSGAR